MIPMITTIDKYTLEIVKTLLKHNVSNVAILATIDTIDKMNERAHSYQQELESAVESINGWIKPEYRTA